MNTIGSVYYGWAFLALCGGGSYYFAKRSVLKDRNERTQMENERRRRQSRMMEESGQNSGQGQFESKAPFRSPKGDRFS